MSATSVTHATNVTNAAAYAQTLLDGIKGAAAPSGIDVLVEDKLTRAIGSMQFIAALFNNNALTVGGTVAGVSTDASKGPGVAATNTALTALLTAAG